MQDSLTQKKVFADQVAFLSRALLGCALITLGAFVRIPFYPVPFTLQTFAITLLALTQTPRQAFASVICYLFCATAGLPVLSGGTSDAFWLLGKSGGYLVGFPIAAYLTAKWAKKLPQMVAVLCGQFTIYLLGFIWLAPFVGASIALMKGVVFFIPSDSLKNLLAIGMGWVWKKGSGHWVHLKKYLD